MGFLRADFTYTSFGPGTVLEMDMDTDGGIGTSTGDMDGLVITLVLSDGRVRSGELRAVNSNLSRVEL